MANWTAKCLPARIAALPLPGSMRITPKDLVAPGSSPGSAPGLPFVAGDNWIAKINEIISGINQLFQQYNQLRQNMPGAFGGQPGGMGPQGSPNPPGGDPTAKMLQAGKILLANLQKQGMGDQPLGQVISQMPETVNQVAALLDQLIARSGKAKGLKGD